MLPGRPTGSRTREIRTLLTRLEEFEALRPSDATRTIVEIGKASLRERLASLARDRRDRPPPTAADALARRAG